MTTNTDREKRLEKPLATSTNPDPDRVDSADASNGDVTTLVTTVTLTESQPTGSQSQSLAARFSSSIYSVFSPQTVSCLVVSPGYIANMVRLPVIILINILSRLLPLRSPGAFLPSRFRYPTRPMERLSIDALHRTTGY